MVAIEKKAVRPLVREIRGKIRTLVGINARHPDEWMTYNSSIGHYDDGFKWVLEGGSIVDVVSKKSFPVVIDLMAPTGTLRDLFRKISEQKKVWIGCFFVGPAK